MEPARRVAYRPMPTAGAGSLDLTREVTAPSQDKQVTWHQPHQPDPAHLTRPGHGVNLNGRPRNLPVGLQRPVA